MNQISLAEPLPVRIAISIQEISACFPVMSELRPHLSLSEFITQVSRQQQECHYQLVYLQADNDIQAVAGFRLSESLSWGKFLYVDDLVTRWRWRSQSVCLRKSLCLRRSLSLRRIRSTIARIWYFTIQLAGRLRSGQ